MNTTDAAELAQTLFEEIGDAAIIVEPGTGQVLDVNPTAQRMTRLPREELLGLSLDQLFRSDGDEALARFRRALDTTQMFHSQEGYYLRGGLDGVWTPVNLTLTRLHTEARPLGLVLARDITERKYAERKLRLVNAALERRVRERTAELAAANEALRAEIAGHVRAALALAESQNLLKAVVEGTPDAVFVKDLGGRYLLINAAAARALGKTAEEVIGKDDRALFAPGAAPPVGEGDRRVMATGEARTFEETTTEAGATRTYLATRAAYRDAQGRVIGLIGLSRDVTELKRLEGQFRQAQKMEAVGRLAGGIAHDFNNLITVINSYGELALRELRPGEPALGLLAEIRKAGERATALTRQLLALSRKQVLRPQVVSLNAVLAELLKLLRRLLGADVELDLVPDPALGLAKVDPGQFEQAVINLAVNARDAMPRGGRLTVETRNAELDEGYADLRPGAEVRPGRYALVSVRDTGQGMDEATRVRAFEPFFTTKEPGRGTGLGLAMVYGFVKQSGGHVEVSSEPGRGTTFELYLPRAAEGTPAESPSEPRAVPGGTETVLLVEDEDNVRALARQVLRSNGYRVLEARDGEEAVEVARRHPEPIHLLLTDVVMPRMSGQRLAELLAPARPGLRILLMSGYSDEAVTGHGRPEANVAFLQKPFDLIGLARKVREVLDAGGG